MQVRVCVPVVPQAVALQEPQLLHPPFIATGAAVTTVGKEVHVQFPTPRLFEVSTVPIGDPDPETIAIDAPVKEEASADLILDKVPATFNAVEV